MDMVSDLFFTINASFDNIIICALSAAFIIIPASASTIQLWRHMEKHWLKDDKLRSWLSTNTKLLYLVSILTGSSFTAIELFNSNLFGFSQFDMGLTRTELMSYQYKRVYSVVLLENFPQLVLQISYILVTTGTRIEAITVTSLTFTVISIIVAVISLFVQKQILFDQDLVMIEFDVCSSAVATKEEACKNMVHGLGKRLSAIVGVDKGLVEILRPTNIPNGLRVHLNIHVVDDDEEDQNKCEEFETVMIDALKSGQVQASFRDCWELNSVPIVSNLSVDTKDSKKKIRKMNTMEGMQMTSELGVRVQSTDPDMNGTGDVDVDVDEVLLNDEDEGGFRIEPGSVAQTNMPQQDVYEEEEKKVDDDLINEVNTIENNETDIDEEVMDEVNTIGNVDEIENFEIETMG